MAVISKNSLVALRTADWFVRGHLVDFRLYNDDPLEASLQARLRDIEHLWLEDVVELRDVDENVGKTQLATMEGVDVGGGVQQFHASEVHRIWVLDGDEDGLDEEEVRERDEEEDEETEDSTSGDEEYVAQERKQGTPITEFQKKQQQLQQSQQQHPQPEPSLLHHGRARRRRSRGGRGTSSKSLISSSKRLPFHQNFIDAIDMKTVCLGSRGSNARWAE